MSEATTSGPDQGNNPDVTRSLTDSLKEITLTLANVLENSTKFQEKQLHLNRRDLFYRNVRFGVIALGIMLYLAIVFNFLRPPSEMSLSDPHVALVRVDGEISAKRAASSENINQALQSAFEDDEAEGVALLINSPGGSPVQSSNIAERIRELREEYPDKKVIAIGEDMLTSGAYMIAVAADEIYINRSTIAGSIGVRTDGFGFNQLIKHLGVERRLYTAGEHKAQLDAFMPVNNGDVDRLNELLTEVHRHFIETVQAYRGDRLVSADNDLFSGDVWVGDRAVEIGIADGIGSLHKVLVDKFGVEQVRDYTKKASLFGRLGKSFGAEVLATFSNNPPVMAVY